MILIYGFKILVKILQSAWTKFATALQNPSSVNIENVPLGSIFIFKGFECVRLRHEYMVPV